jgi:hypothetical protein
MEVHNCSDNEDDLAELYMMLSWHERFDILEKSTLPIIVYEEEKDLFIFSGEEVKEFLCKRLQPGY